MLRWEDYCRERWGLGRAHAYRLIDAAATAEAVSPVGDITNERQARALSGLPAEEQRKVHADDLAAALMKAAQLIRGTGGAAERRQGDDEAPQAAESA